MTGHWADSDRRERLPGNWSELVRKVKARAGGRCEWRLKSGARCPRPGTDVDHRLRGDDHRMGNLQLLCADHHKKKTALEARLARATKRVAGKLTAAPHPGRKPQR